MNYVCNFEQTCLCHIHGLNTFPGKRPRLWNHIGFLREMDLAINRHGFKNLSLDQMRKVNYNKFNFN